MKSFKEFRNDSTLHEGFLQNLRNRFKRTSSQPRSLWIHSKDEIGWIVQGMWYYMEELMKDSRENDRDNGIVMETLIKNIEIEINREIPKEDYMGFGTMFFYHGIKPHWESGDKAGFQKEMYDALLGQWESMNSDEEPMKRKRFQRSRVVIKK